MTTMEKYGTLTEDILFELDDWAIVPPPEGCDGMDCVHACNRKDLEDTHIAWSYTLPDDPNCPGCNALMPDEVQGLLALGNMDCANGHLTKRHIEIVFAKAVKRAAKTWEQFDNDFMKDKK